MIILENVYLKFLKVKDVLLMFSKFGLIAD